MTFTANTVKTNDGRFGYLGLALQTQPGTFVAPSIFMPETGGQGVKPDFLKRRDEFFALSRFQGAAAPAGYDLKFTWSGELSPAALLFWLGAIVGPASNGVITPVGNTQWSTFLPLPAVCGQWYVPTAGLLQFLDAQVMELTITIPSDRTKNATYSATAQACTGIFVGEGEANGDVTPATPVIQGYGQNYYAGNTSFTLGGVTIVPDGDVTLKIMNPLDPLPASGATIPGFASSTNPSGLEITTKFNGGQQFMLDADRDSSFLALTYNIGTHVFNLTGQVSAYTIPIGAGRVVTDATFQANSQTPGAAPFSITA